MRLKKSSTSKVTEERPHDKGVEADQKCPPIAAKRPLLRSGPAVLALLSANTAVLALATTRLKSSSRDPKRLSLREGVAPDRATVLSCVRFPDRLADDERARLPRTDRGGVLPWEY